MQLQYINLKMHGTKIRKTMEKYTSVIIYKIINEYCENCKNYLIRICERIIIKVVTSYLIVIAGTVLIFGRLGDMVGKAKMFKFGLGLFTFGSFLFL